MTLTEDSAMAAAAIIGDSRMPKVGIEHARRNGNARRVVDEGEEQVLPDIVHHRLGQKPRPDNAHQVALEQGDAGAFHGNIGSRSHGNADIRRGKGRRVIHAIARHGHHPALRLEPGNDIGLLGRAAHRLRLR